MRATEQKLGDLHGKVCQIMLTALQRMETLSKIDLTDMEDAELLEKALAFVEPSPAFLTVVLRFLKDNEITAIAEVGDDQSELRDQFRKMRGGNTGSNVTTLPIATQG